MIGLPDAEDARELRAFLRGAAFTEARLAERFGSAAPPARESIRPMLHASRQPSLENLLVRLFLVGSEAEAEAWERLVPAAQRERLESLGLVQRDGARVRPGVTLVPVGELLLASDPFHRLGGDGAADFVMPASTHSARFLERLMLREPVASVLDLGTGCGLHALVAAGHARRVIATDVNPTALAYAAFNARLNGIDNVECRQGDGFTPLAGERVDRIVSNPPFVLSPGEDFRYRDNAGELDAFCAELLEAAPGFLEDGGVLQMLCEFADVGDVPWHERLGARLRERGCDAFVLHGQALAPPEYVARRSGDVSGPATAPATPYADWLAYLEQHDVRAVHPLVVVLRKRGGRNWFQMQALGGEPGSTAWRDLAEALGSAAWLDEHGGDNRLPRAVLSLSPAVELVQRFAREDGAWVPVTSRLERREGLRLAADVDLPVMAFLNQLDGRRPLGDVIADFAAAVGTDRERLCGQLLPLIRLLIARGFVVTDATPSDR